MLRQVQGCLSFLMPIIGHGSMQGQGFHPPHRIDIDIVPCAAAEIWGGEVAFLPLGHRGPVQPLGLIYSTRIATLRLFDHQSETKHSSSVICKKYKI